MKSIKFKLQSEETPTGTTYQARIASGADQILVPIVETTPIRAELAMFRICSVVNQVAGNCAGVEQ